MLTHPPDDFPLPDPRREGAIRPGGEAPRPRANSRAWEVVVVSADSGLADLVAAMLGEGAFPVVVHHRASPDDLLAALDDLASHVCLADGAQCARALLDLVESGGIDEKSFPIIAVARFGEILPEAELARRGAQDCLQLDELTPPEFGRALRHGVERHRGVLEVHCERGRLRSALEASVDGVMVVDEAGLVRFANRGARAMLGPAGGELLNRPLGRPVAAGQSFEINIERGDGSPGVAEMRVERIAWGEQPALIACMRDITERKESERNLIESQARIKALSSQLLRADHRERRRIAAGLHDDVAQLLVGIKLNHEIFARRVAHDPDLVRVFDVLNELTLMAIRSTRSLVFDLVPPSLYEAGFRTALSDMVDQMSARFGLVVHLSVDPACEGIDSDVASFIYQAVRESLMNVVKHAETKTARVECALGEGRLSAEVSDSGRGFDPEAVPAQTDAAAPRGFGSFNLRERFRQAGGGYEIISSPGAGTTVRMWAPLEH